MFCLEKIFICKIFQKRKKKDLVFCVLLIDKNYLEIFPTFTTKKFISVDLHHIYVRLFGLTRKKGNKENIGDDESDENSKDSSQLVNLMYIKINDHCKYREI